MPGDELRDGASHVNEDCPLWSQPSIDSAMGTRKEKIAYFYDRMLRGKGSGAGRVGCVCGGLTRQAFPLPPAAEYTGYYYGADHPMKPQRIAMTHQLILGYGLHSHMQVYVRRDVVRSGGGVAELLS